MAEPLPSFVSPPKTPLASPVLDMHSCWVQCSKEEKEGFDETPWRDALEDFLIMMMQSEACIDVHNPGRLTTCNCMNGLDLADSEKEQVLDYLVTYAKMSRDDQRSLIWEWKRYSKVFGNDIGERGAYGGRTYLLPGTTHMICKNAIAMIVRREETQCMEQHQGAGKESWLEEPAK